MPQPHQTVIVFVIDLHRPWRKLFVLSSSLFLSDQPKPISYQTHPRSLIYKPISSLSPPSNPPTDLATIKPTYQSRRCQTHSPISSPSDPPTDLWSFTSFSQSISPSLSLMIGAYFLERLNFFCYVLLLILFIYSDFLL